MVLAGCLLEDLERSPIVCFRRRKLAAIVLHAGNGVIADAGELMLLTERAAEDAKALLG